MTAEVRHCDGGPAFPNPKYSDVNGMSLRDWFAGRMMDKVPLGDTEGYEYWMREAYKAADVALKVREEQ
jgi:hypothetical protein